MDVGAQYAGPGPGCGLGPASKIISKNTGEIKSGIVLNFCHAVVFCGAMAILSACANPFQQQASQNVANEACTQAAMSTQFIVKWKSGKLTRENAESAEAFQNNFVTQNQDQIEFAEPDYKVHLSPSPHLGNLVQENANPPGNNSWGQNMVQAPTAWSNGVTGQNVVVAVIDSGVDLTHPQLKNQIAGNPGEIGTDSQGRNKATNGVDDDGNGLIDDAYGYDFLNNAPLTGDQNGHGTHVSGIVLADPNYGPIQGMAPGAKLLPLRFMDANGDGSLSAAMAAINYAAQRGAKVINASWGGAFCSQGLKQTIAGLAAQGVLFVVAAGNNGTGTSPEGTDLASTPVYPAALGFSGQITVAASTSIDQLAGFSNFDFSLVHLAAPGENILSTWPGGGTQLDSGTSMATPFVVGAAALLWSTKPQATPAQIKQALLASVDSGPFQVSTQGRLNVAKAIQSLAQALP